MGQLMNQIAAMGRSVNNQTKERSLKAGAQVMKRAIEEKAPVRTGNLKANIVASDVKDDLIAIGPDQQGPAYYGHFLEFGTSKAAAKPFMGPAYENSKEEAQEAMSDVIKRELNL
ncbi:HK97 gp10 family phage protein [Bacillus sp. AG4(2022)]|nr:HK97 gp10 family phage protein [Bacillus sp. AG4(2022)]